MRTAVVSDLHLGAPRPARTWPRDPGARERAGRGARRMPTGVVLLGDVLELRERPLAEALEVRPAVLRGARPRRWPGARVVLVPGNHDHALAEPWLGAPAAGRRELAPRTASGRSSRATARRAGSPRAMPDAELTPRLPRPAAAPRRLRDPRPLPRPAPDRAAARVDRRLGDGPAHRARPRRARSAADYEAVLAPIYALPRRARAGRSLRAALEPRAATCSRDVWRAR